MLNGRNGEQRLAIDYDYGKSWCQVLHSKVYINKMELVDEVDEEDASHFHHQCHAHTCT